MKKTLISVAAVAALTTGAFAADKGVDLDVTGQAVLYYETKALDTTGDAGMFSQANSNANVGVQLNAGGDIGDGYTLGTQLSWIGTNGLEKNLVGGVKQTGASNPINPNAANELALSKVFVAKKIGATTLKIGRQELPKSLSPLAYSEGWNVFKNTFDATVIINSDLPDTTVVAAWVGTSNSSVGTGLSQMTDMVAKTGLGNVDVAGGAYMLTVANKSIPMTALTASYYSLQQLALGATALDNGSAAWLDVAVAGKELPLGLAVGLQGGTIMLDSGNAAVVATAAKDTTAFGVKVGMKPIKALSLQVAYTSVDDGAVAVKNVGTGVKSPLYTQAIYNQDFISSDAATLGLKAGYSLGDLGAVTAIYSMTTDNSAAATAENYSELDLIYKVKSGGVTYWASAMLRSMDRVAGSTAWTSDNKVRLWVRKAF